jgi:hypothetical protein
VWHCHILSHEEMDFMHSLVFAVPPKAVTNLSVTRTNTTVRLAWTDLSIKETGYRIERALDPNFTVGLTSTTRTNAAATGPMTFTQTVQNNRAYWYRVWAIGPVVGDTTVAGFPTMSANSVSNTVVIAVGTLATPAGPIGLSGTWQPTPVQVNLAWTDTSTNETHFVIERCTGTNCTTFAALPVSVPAHAGTGVMTFVDTTVANPNVYSYRVRSFNGTVPSAYSNVAANVSGAAATVPVAPTGLTVSLSAGTATLNWSHPGGANLTDFTIQRATNATFTVGVSSLSAPAGTTTALDAVPGAGPYYYRIRANGSAGSSAWTNASPFPVGGVLVVTGLNADVASPAPNGTTITWTATASGGTSPLQYQFWRYSYATGLWTIAQAYSTSSVFSWATTPADAGMYIISVWVKSAGSAGAFDASLSTNAYTIAGAPLTVTGVTGNPPGTAPAGTAVTWTVSTTGGTAPLQYEFWRYSYATGLWTIVQPYSTSNTFTWNTAAPDAGTYIISVWVKSAGSPLAFDASLSTAAYTITP